MDGSEDDPSTLGEPLAPAARTRGVVIGAAVAPSDEHAAPPPAPSATTAAAAELQVADRTAGTAAELHVADCAAASATCARCDDPGVWLAFMLLCRAVVRACVRSSAVQLVGASSCTAMALVTVLAPTAPRTALALALLCLALFALAWFGVSAGDVRRAAICVWALLSGRTGLGVLGALVALTAAALVGATAWSAWPAAAVAPAASAWTPVAGSTQLVDWGSWTNVTSRSVRSAACVPIDNDERSADGTPLVDLRAALCGMLDAGQPLAVAAHVGERACLAALRVGDDCLAIANPEIVRSFGGRVAGRVSSPFCPHIHANVTLDASVVIRGRALAQRTLSGAAAAVAQLAVQQLRGRSLCDQPA